jgi:hypothetical protein
MVPDVVVTTQQNSQQTSALEALFTSSARVAVLRIFMLDPHREYYQRQIEAATGLPIRAVQRELERMTAVSLFYRRMEGNRTYYQANLQHLLFPELRGLVLKTSSDQDRIRGELAMDERIRLAILDEETARLMVVAESQEEESIRASASPYELILMPVDDFVNALSAGAADLAPFLNRGIDLLGRRDDVLWRRIELAGFEVKKGRGVP